VRSEVADLSTVTRGRREGLVRREGKVEFVRAPSATSIVAVRRGAFKRVVVRASMAEAAGMVAAVGTAAADGIEGE